MTFQEFNIKDNKVVQMPSCFDALRQKVKVEFEGQSSYKFREPVDRQRPSVPQSDANTDQKPAEKQPTVGKQRKSKSAKKGKAAKVTLNDVIVAPPAVAGEVIAEQTAETDAPAPTDGATANGVDDQLTDKGHAQELQQKSLTIS